MSLETISLDQASGLYKSSFSLGDLTIAILFCMPDINDIKKRANKSVIYELNIYVYL
jgi:hypothetical protein